MTTTLSLDQLALVLAGLEMCMDAEDLCDAERQRLEWAHETVLAMARRRQDREDAGAA